MLPQVQWNPGNPSNKSSASGGNKNHVFPTNKMHWTGTRFNFPLLLRIIFRQVPSHFDSLKRSSARERGEAEHIGREKNDILQPRPGPRALISGFGGGADLGRTTSKAREKRPGDEVGYSISMSEMLVVTSAIKPIYHSRKYHNIP